MTGRVIRGNVVSKNGIDVDSAATTLTRIPRCANWDRGVEAVAGVTYGGRNKARGDGNPAQCTNSTRTSSTFACG